MGLALLASAGILVVTLTPAPGIPRAIIDSTPLLCLLCGSRGTVDALLNVLLFVPLGFALSARGSRLIVVVAAGAGLSLAVELLQATVIQGRDASLGDFVANSAGSALGTVIQRQIRGILAPNPTRARRSLAAWYVGWLTQVSVTIWSLAPSPTITQQYVGQWAQVFPGTVSFRGSVRRSSVDDIAFGDGPVDNTVAIREAMTRHPTEFYVDASGGPPAAGTAQIVALSDGAQRVIFSFVQEGCVVSFTQRTRANDAGLAPLSVAAPIPCSQEGGDGLAMNAVTTSESMVLTVAAGLTKTSRELTYTPNMGWTLLVPFEWSYQRLDIGSAVWLALLMLPLGWWARWSSPDSGIRSLVFVAGFVAATLLGAPWFAGLKPIGWAEWLAAAFAIVCGWAGAHTLRPRGSSTSPASGAAG